MRRGLGQFCAKWVTVVPAIVGSALGPLRPCIPVTVMVAYYSSASSARADLVVVSAPPTNSFDAK